MKHGTLMDLIRPLSITKHPADDVHELWYWMILILPSTSWQSTDADKVDPTLKQPADLQPTFFSSLHRRISWSSMWLEPSTLMSRDPRCDSFCRVELWKLSFGIVEASAWRAREFQWFFIIFRINIAMFDHFWLYCIILYPFSAHTYLMKFTPQSQSRLANQIKSGICLNWSLWRQP